MMTLTSGQRKQDSCYSWVVCISGTLASAVTIGLMFSFGVLYPVLLDHFKERKDKTAWVGSLGIALIFFSGPLTGNLINRFGCRTISLVGAVTCTVSLVLTSFSNSLVTMYFAYSVLFGLGTSLVFAPALVMVGKYFDKRRAFASGIFGSGGSAGVMCLGPILDSLLATFGWRYTYRIMAGAVLGFCLLGCCFYDPNVERGHRVTIDDPSLTQSAEEISLLHKEEINASVWRNPEFVKTALLAAVVNFGEYSPSLHLVRYCEDIGISSDLASKLFIYYGLSSIFGKILFGRLCDFHCVNARYICQAAVFLAGTITILVTLSKNYTVLAAYVVVFGICEGAFISTIFTVILTCVPEEQRASAIGWQWLLSSFSLASGPPLVGLMAEKLGSYVPAFYMVGGVIIFGSLVPLLLQCFRQQSSETLHEDSAAEHSNVPCENNTGPNDV